MKYRQKNRQRVSCSRGVVPTPPCLQAAADTFTVLVGRHDSVTTVRAPPLMTTTRPRI